jgi:nucleoside-diphosphate-sugar epimerase
MNTPTILVTGALGEVGHGLLSYFNQKTNYKVVALDLNKPKTPLQGDVVFYQGDILDKDLINRLNQNHRFEAIFHLATILSSGGERNPQLAHEVNVDGGMNILTLAKSQSEEFGKPVKVIFPSSCAVYAIRPPADKNEAGSVLENQFLEPITMYGINKLYMENLGRYFSEHYNNNGNGERMDFRCVRFPGLLSAETVPSGGTSDYGPEMIHAAAQGEPYSCFVSEDSKLPFMSMTDAIRSLIAIWEAPSENLTRRVYNVTAFAVTAKEIEREVKKHFPAAQISYEPVAWRQAVVDTWPADMDDSAARKDWGWKPEMDFEHAFGSYLVPGAKKNYESPSNTSKNTTTMKKVANG